MKLSILPAAVLLAAVCGPASLAQTLCDGSFEQSPTTSPGIPTSTCTWGGDQASVVPAGPGGLLPYAGASMVQIRATEVSGGHCTSILGSIHQSVSTSGLATDVTSGRVVARLSARANRVAGTPASDRRMNILIQAYDGDVSTLPGRYNQPLSLQVGRLESDADPSTWELIETSLQLPPQTTFVVVTLQAREDVTNDCTAEFDGHYFDDVQLSFELSESMLLDGGFEGAGPQCGRPTVAGRWSGEGLGVQLDFFGANPPFPPESGRGMLRFIGAGPCDGSAGPSSASQCWQIIDLRSSVGVIRSGQGTARASALFNRVHQNGSTDTEFSIMLRAYEGDPADFPTVWNTGYLASQELSILTDGDTNTWERAEVSMALPLTTDYAVIEVAAIENIQNNVGGTEFHGHFADGVTFELEGGVGSSYCGPAQLNSAGRAAEIVAGGSASIGADNLSLIGVELPPLQFTLFLASLDAGFVTNPGGSSGHLCLGGQIGRFNRPGQITQANATGIAILSVDLSAIPVPTGTAAAMPGASWHFQAWYRDADPSGGPTSNFTDAVRIDFL